MAMSPDIVGGSPRLAVHLPSNPPPRGMRPASASARVSSRHPPLERRYLGEPSSSRLARPLAAEVGETASGYVKYTGELDVWVPCEHGAGEPTDTLPAPALRDMAQAIFELRTGMATRKDVERLMAEVKTEVKTEASVLRQKFSAAMHPTVGDGRTMRRLGGGLEAPDLGGSSTDLKSMECSIAGILRTLQEVISPKIAGLSDVVREVKAVNDTVREMQVCTPVSSSTDVSSVSEEVRKLRTSVTELTALLEPPRIGELSTPRSAPLQPHFMVGPPAGLSGAGRRPSGHTEGLARAAAEAASAEGARAEDADSNPVLAAIKESRTQVLRELRDVAKRHETDVGMIAAAVRGTSKPNADVTSLAMELRQLQPRVRAEVTGAVSAIKEAADSLAGELAQRIAAAAGDARELLAAVRESQAFEHKTSLTGEIKQLQAQAQLNTQELLTALRESKASGADTSLREALAELQSKSEQSSAELLKALQQSKDAASSAEVTKATQEGKAPEAVSGLGQELRELRSKSEKSCAEVLSAVQELHSKSEQRSAEVLKAVQESKELHSKSEERSAEVLKAVQESKASEAVSGLSQELRELHGKAERRSAEVLDALQQGKAAGEQHNLARELQQLRSQAEVNVGEIIAAVRDSQGLDTQAGVVREVVRELLAKSRAELLEALQLRESKAGEEGKRVLESVKQLQVDFEEVRERRPEAYLAPVMGELRQLQSQVTGDCSSMLQAVRDGKMKVDLSPVLKAIELTKTEVDTSVLLKAIRAVKTEVDFSEVLQAIDQAKKSVDFSPVLRGIREHNPEVDFAPVMQALRSSRTSPDLSRGLQDILQAVAELKEGRLQMDCTPVLKEVQRCESAILSAMAEGRVDFSVVTKKVEEIRPKVDFQAEFSQLTRTVHAHKPEVDLSPVLEAITESRTALEASRGLKDVKQQLRELSEGNLQVDFAPLMKEVRQVQSQSASGTATLLAALEEAKADSASTSKALEQSSRLLTQLLDGKPEADAALLRQTQSQVDAGATAVIAVVRESVAANAAHAEESALRAAKEVDLSPVLQAIQDGRAALESSESMQEVRRAVSEIREGKLVIDFSPVLKQVQQGQSHLDAQFSAMRSCAEEGKVDLLPVLQAIQETRTALDSSQSIEEIGKAVAEVKEGKVGLDLSPILKEVQQKHDQLDAQLTAVRSSIEEGRAEMDVPKMLKAIEHSKAEVDLSPVLEAISEAKATLDCSQHVKEVKDAVTEIKEGKASLHLPGFEEHISATRRAVEDGKVDLSPVLSAINDARAALDCSEHFKEMKDVMAEIKEGKLELDFSAVLGEVREKHERVAEQCAATRKAVADAVPEVVKAVEAGGTKVSGKLDLDFACVLSEIQQKHNQLEEQFLAVRRIMKDTKEVMDVPKILEAIESSKTEVDLSPVMAAIEESKVRDGKLGSDISAVLREVQQKFSEVEEQFSAVCKAVITGESSKPVDLSLVLAAISDTRTALDFSRQIKEIKDVVAEVQQKHDQVEGQFVAVHKAIADGKVEVDLSPVLAAIVAQSKTAVESQQRIQEVKDTVAEVKEGSAALGGMQQRLEEQFLVVRKAVEDGKEGSAALGERLEEHLQAVRKAAEDGREGSRTVGEVQQRLEEQFSAVRKAVEDGTQGSANALGKVQQKLEEQLLAVRRAVEDGEDTSKILRAIEANKTEVDLAPVLAAIDGAKTVLDCSQHLQEIKQAVVELKEDPLGLDVSAILGEVRAQHKQVEGQLLQLRKSMEERMEVVRTSVLGAIKDTQTALDCSQHIQEIKEVLQEVKEGDVELDFSAVLDEVKQTSSKLEVHILAVQKAMDDKTEDVPKLLKAIETSRTEVDFSPVLAAIADSNAAKKAKDLMAEINHSAMLGAMQKTQNQVQEQYTALQKAIEDGKEDVPKILQAIKANRTEVDLSPVLAAVQDTKASQHIKEIRDVVAEVNFSAVLSAVQQTHREVEGQYLTLRKALEDGREDAPKILKAIETSRTEVQQRHSQVEEQLLVVRKAAEEGKHVPKILEAIEASKAEVQQKHVQVEEQLLAIRKVAEEGKEAAHVPKILEAIEASKTEVQQKHGRVEEQLLAIRKVAEEGKEAAHVPKILEAIEASKTEVRQKHAQVEEQLLAVRKVAEEGNEAAHVPKILEAIEASKTQVQQKHVQVEEQLLAIRKVAEEGKEAAHVPKILEAIEASKTEVQQKHVQVEDQLLAVRKAAEEGKEAAHVTKILEAIEATKTEAQQKHVKVEEQLLAIRKAAEEGKEAAHVPKILAAIETSKTEVQQKHVKVEEQLLAIRKAAEEGKEAAHVPKILEAIESSKTEVQRRHSQVEEQLLAVRKAVEDANETAHPKLLKAIEASKTEVDLSPVLAAIKDTKATLDCSQHLGEIKTGLADVKKGKVDLDFSAVLHELRERSDQVDKQLLVIRKAIEDGREAMNVPKILKAIETSKTEVDLSPVLAAIEDSKTALNCSQPLKEIKEGVEEVKKGKIDLDFSAVLNAFQERSSQVEKQLAAVRKAVEEGREAVDVPKILKAIEASKAEVDLSPVLAAIESSRSALDSSQRLKEIKDVLADVKKGKLDLDFSAILNEFQERNNQVERQLLAIRQSLQDGVEVVDVPKIVKAIEENKTEVDLSPVLAAIQDSKTALDCCSQHVKEVGDGVAEVRKGKLQMDFSPVLNEFQERNNQVERQLLAVCKAVEEIKGSLADVRRGKLDLDFSAILNEFQAKHDQVERQLLVVRKAIEDCKEVDFSPVLTAIRDSKTALDCSQDIKEIKGALAEVRRGKLDLDFSSVLHELQQKHIRVEEQLSATRRAVEDGQLHEAQQRHQQVEEQLLAIRKTVEDGKRTDVPKILKAIEASRTEVDLSPVFSAIHESKIALDCTQHVKEVKAMLVEVKERKVDLAPVLEAIRDIKTAVESSQGIKEVKEAVAQVVVEVRRDMRQQLRGGEETRGAEVGLFQHIREIKEAVTEVREGKMDLGSSPGLNELRQRHGQVIEQLLGIRQAIDDGRAETVPWILRAIETTTSQVTLLPVLEAIQETKITLENVTHLADIRKAVAEIKDSRPELQLLPVLNEMQRKQGQAEEQLAAVLNEVQRSQSQVQEQRRSHSQVGEQLSAVRRAVEEEKKVDFSTVLEAIGDTKTAFREVAAEVRDSKPDFTPILSDIQRKHKLVEEQLSALRSAIRAGLGDADVPKIIQVDLSPVLEAIKDTRIASIKAIKDMAAEVRDSKPDLDFSPVLGEVQQKHSVVEEQLSALRKAIDGAASVEVPRILSAIEASRTKVDLSPVLDAIEESKAGLDCSQHFKEVKDGVTDIKKGKLDLDFSAVLHEFQERSSHLERQLLVIRKAVDEGREAVDVPKILSAIEANRTEVDLTPVLNAIDDTRTASVKAVREVVTEAVDGKPGPDFSPILDDVQKKHNLVEEQLSAVRKAIQEELDVPRILAAIETSSTKVVAEVQEGKPSVDLSPVLLDAQQKHHLLEEQMAALRKGIEEGRVEVDVPSILKAIDTSRTEVVTAIGTAKPEVDFSVVLKELETNKLEAALVHSIDGKVTAQAHLLSGLLAKLDDVVGRHEELRLWCLRTMREPSPRGVQQPQVTSTWRPAAAPSRP